MNKFAIENGLMGWKNVLSVLISLGILSLPFVPPSEAEVVFSNFGQPGYVYETTQNTGWTIYNGVSGFAEGAMGFTPTADFFFDGFKAEILNASNTADLNIWLMSLTPSLSIIESFPFKSILFSDDGSSQPPLAGNSILHPKLSAGETYWLAASLPEIGAFHWKFNSIGDTGPVAGNASIPPNWSTSGGPFRRGAFEIDGTPAGAAPVPEPATMLLLGSGLFGLWGARRKFKK